MTTQQMIDKIKTLIFTKYGQAKIKDKGYRSLKQQIVYFLRTPQQYSKTYSDYIKAMKEPLPKSYSELSKKQLDFLTKRINYYSNAGIGYRHLKGKAIDVSVIELTLEKKKQFKADIEKLGFNIIMEKIDGSNSKYNVPINSANVFHIEMKESGIKKTKQTIKNTDQFYANHLNKHVFQCEVRNW